MTITVYGSSDDLIDVHGCKGGDEFTLPSSNQWRGDLIAPNGEQLRLHVLFDGCWHVAVGQVDEDVPFPAWPLRFTQHENGYSVQLTLGAPDGTRLTNTTES